MSGLNPTPAESLIDSQGRPYFLWDIDMTLDRFRHLVEHGDLEQRCYLIGKLMRQAKPDDVFTFVTVAEIRKLWTGIEPYLGRTREFWAWLLEQWRAQGVA